MDISIRTRLSVASVVSQLFTYTIQMDIGNICNTQLVNVVKGNLTVAAEAESVVSLPGGRLGSVVVAVAFSETAVLFSNAGETASLPAFVHRLGDPVDPRVATNLRENPVNIRWGRGTSEDSRPCDWGQRG